MDSLTDEQARVIEALDKHVLVAAGAGSGKTKVLVERYVRTLLQNTEKLSPGNIVAVTYTKRAASEMRNRIKAKLEESIAGATDPQKKDRLLGFRLQIDSAPIGTIHALCESILRTFPEEARVDPAFEVLDTLDSQELIRGCIEQALLELLATDKPVQQLLSQYETDTVIGWVMKTIKQRTDFEAACKSLPGLSEQDLRSHGEKLLQAAQNMCLEKANKNNKLSSYLDSAAGFESKTLRYPSLNIVLKTTLAVRKRLSCATSVTEKFLCLKELSRLKFPGGKRSGDEADLEAQLRELCIWLNGFVGEVAEQLNQLDETSFALIPGLIASHNRALEIYKRKKQELKALDYHDQIEATHELLKDPHSRARKHYNENLEAVLVDEFQDTNILQSEIIGYLAGPRARVLLIGDEKQSIYKFQGADLSVFSSWSNWFASPEERFPYDWEGERVFETLSLSFRGHPGLTMFINNVFHHVLNGHGLMRKYQAQYRELVPAREGNVEARTHLVHFNSTGNGMHGTENDEGVAVAAWIKDMVQAETSVMDESGAQRRAEYGDFAVLLPQHSNFQRFEEAFSALNLPYASMGGKSFLSTQEVFDLENLLSFISCSLNDQALFGILRSPFFGITDDVLQLLFNYSKQSNSASLWQSLKGFSAAQNPSDEKLQRALEILNVLLEAAQRLSLPELLRQAIELTSYDVTLLSLPSGKRRSRNVWKFISMAEEQESLTVSQFLQRLATARTTRVEERAAPLDAGNSIKLMTIHTAKGLEFPIVVLPCMDTRVNPGLWGTDAKLVFHPEYGIALNVGQRDDKPAYFQVCRFLQDELEAAEKRRLFYVAASRARDHLGIFLQDESIKIDCSQRWLAEAIPSHEIPLPDTSPKQQEFHGAFGMAPYYASMHMAAQDNSLEANLMPDDKRGQFLDDADENDPLIAQLSTGIKKNHALMEDFSGQQDIDRIKSDKWMRVTSESIDDINDELGLGSYFHSVMEYFAATKQKPDTKTLEVLARTLNGRATDVDLQAALVHEVEKLLPVFYQSELYSIMLKAKKLLFERGYLSFNNAKNGYSSKRPDLLLQDAEGRWCIVDYKTDVVSADPSKQKIPPEYRQQVLTYVNDIKSICNIDANGYLYFARTGQLCEAALAASI